MEIDYNKASGHATPLSPAEVNLAALSQFVLAAALAFQAGCSSPATKHGRELLAQHPTNETRMSLHAEKSYVPSGVWRIQGLHNTLYLAGTSHLFTSNQVPFPSPFYAAYRDAKEIYIEFDENLSAWEQLRLVFKLRKWVKGHLPDLIYADDKTLQTDLSPATITELKQFYGRKYPQRERMTPAMLAFLAQAETMADQYATDGGVDAVFAAFARKDGKRIRELDDSSVDDVALLVLDDMLLGLRNDIRRRGADAVVREKVLGDRKPVEDATWRNGDLMALEKENEETEHDSPKLYEKLGPERNRKWMLKLTDALRARHNVMVLVGAAHLAGKTGLLNLLRDAGYRVEQLYGVDPRAPGPKK